MLKRIIVGGCLVILAAQLAWGAEDTFQIPPDLMKLLPADPVFIAAISSVNDLDRQWRAIEDMMDEGDGDRTDLVGLISDQLPQFSEYADLDRPLVVAMGLPNLMGNEEPPLTIIVPLSGSFDDRVKREMEDEELVHFIEGGYVAFSPDTSYVPAGSVPDLVAGLSPGFFSATLDLEAVIDAYRPLAEMGLGAMANAPAVPDTGGADGPPPPRMDAEETAALQDLARSLMDSARRFDMALQIEGDVLTFHTGFAAHPGSALDPGPQPSFEQALQLTRLLPAGGDITQVMAMDQTRQFEVFRAFHQATLEGEITDMPPEQAEAYRAWVETYLDSMDLFTNPLAASIVMDEGSISANMVMGSSEAHQLLKRYGDLFAGLTAVDLGISLKAMPTGRVAGVEVHSWKVVYDAEKMAGIALNPGNPHLSGTGRTEADQMIAILRKVTPNINLAARGDFLIFSADSDAVNLAHMIQAAGQRRGAANPEVAAVAAAAGPHCQQVVTGDLMSILTWVTEWMGELEDEEYEVIKGNPIPFTSAYTIAGANYGVDWTMDMPAVKRLVKAAQDLEAMEEARRYDDDASGEAEAEAEETD